MYCSAVQKCLFTGHSTLGPLFYDLKPHLATAMSRVVVYSLVGGDRSDFADLLVVENLFSTFLWSLCRRPERKPCSGQHLSVSAFSSLSDGKRLTAQSAQLHGHADFCSRCFPSESSIGAFNSFHLRGKAFCSDSLDSPTWHKCYVCAIRNFRRVLF